MRDVRAGSSAGGGLTTIAIWAVMMDEHEAPFSYSGFPSRGESTNES
ncbi:hypothetical protein [Kitasatospora sp. CB02891]|nr:hypothetical protein [Kitasatospora sp. CB02891]